MKKFLTILVTGLIVNFPSNAGVNSTNPVGLNNTNFYTRSFDTLEFNSPSISSRDIECLARNIYYESRGETLRGQLAVAAVTLNRVNDPRFPNNICRVVYQRENRKCQFSWTCMRNRPPTGESWYRSLELARTYLNGHHPDPTNGAIYFSNPRNTSFGRNVRTATVIGNHRFWR